ncbi:MAG: hypothetical protein IPM69_16780 [Ignavibacteria bacterium]|nr:hypothetical protein [Ignavibacteria bacterium]
MDIILNAHSHTRWLVLTIAVVTVLLYLFGWLSKRSFSKFDRIMGSVFVGILDMQALIGIVMLVMLLVEGTTLQVKQLEHIGTMFCAVAIAHLTARWKKLPDTLRFRNSLLFYIMALILVIHGIIRLRGGLTW